MLHLAQDYRALPVLFFFRLLLENKPAFPYNFSSPETKRFIVSCKILLGMTKILHYPDQPRQPAVLLTFLWVIVRCPWTAIQNQYK